MSYLLDTHTFVWALMEPDKLSASARAVITDVNNPLFLSAATAWEISTKVRLGRWPAAAPVAHGFPGAAKRLRTISLPISNEDALSAGQLEWEHADPFDRMLVAQALNNGLRIVTADQAITQHPVSTIW